MNSTSKPNVHSALSQAIKDDTAGMRIDLSLITDKVSQLYSHGRGRTIECCMKHTKLISPGQERHRIVNWLSQANFVQIQKETFAKRQVGTGDWILNCEEFQTWLDGPRETLWCHGMRRSSPV